MFIDASALCAILFDEPERDAFSDRIEAVERRMTSPLAVYETAMALARCKAESAGDAGRRVEAFLSMARVEIIQIDPRIGAVALDAHDRFGKGRHPARLNMGDCFAYACARTRNVPLLFKGEDFALTDVAVALSADVWFLRRLS